MPQPDEAVVDFLILVPEMGAILVELEVGGVDDAHAARSFGCGAAVVNAAGHRASGWRILHMTIVAQRAACGPRSSR
ncbi:hypothetical protein llg_19360 [Luteolibacter sp. LG18]|nr:hypothetical protein llg_19360 [Luteolibacter sp. LG18]